MDSATIIEIVKASSGSIDNLISQTAWYFAVQAAARWFSVTLPLLILFGIFLKVSQTLKVAASKPEVVGALVITAWVLFAATLFTGVRGLAHVVQAAVAPSIYVASEVGGIVELLKATGGK